MTCINCWPAQRAYMLDHGEDPFKLPKEKRKGPRPPECHPMPENCYLRKVNKAQTPWERS